MELLRFSRKKDVLGVIRKMDLSGFTRKMDYCELLDNGFIGILRNNTVTRIY